VRDNVRGTYLQVEGQPSARCTLYAREDTRATNNVERSAVARPKQRAIATFPGFPDVTREIHEVIRSRFPAARPLPLARSDDTGVARNENKARAIINGR